MDRQEKNTPQSVRFSSLPFELYHFLVVALLTTGYGWLMLYTRSVQRDLTSAYRQDLTTVIFVFSPVIFCLAFRWITGRIRPGRIFFQMLITCLLIQVYYPQHFEGWNSISKFFSWPVFFFAFYFAVSIWMKGKKVWHVAQRKEMQKKKLVTEREATQTPAPQRVDVMRSKRIPEGGFVIDAPRERSVRSVIVDLILLPIVVGFGFAFVLLIQAWDRPWWNKQFIIYMLILIYPAFLYGAVKFTTGSAKPGLLFIASLFTLGALWLILPDKNGVVFLLFPTVTFGVGYLFTLVKEKPRKKLAVVSGADPRALDEEIDERQDAKRRVERKYRSKRENSRWYAHPWYYRRS